MGKVTSERHFTRAKKGFLLDLWIFIYLHVWISYMSAGIFLTRVKSEKYISYKKIFLAVLKFPKRLKVNIRKKEISISLLSQISQI